jgi:multidrug resistance efflux pump
VIAAAPRLRRDLTVSRLETANGAYLIVKHPVSGRFYRFRAAERFIAEQLDGETPLDVIRERAEAEFGASLGAETLHAFVKNLDTLGLLENGKPVERPRRDRGKRIRGSLLYLRLALIDPDRLFTRLIPRIRFLFTRQFLVLAAVPILLAFALTFANAREIAQDLPRLYQASAILPFLMLILVVATVHEFAHGLTCKHFGGEVHEVGFMVMYFQPAFYCNVSDAWLFPEKSKRLWVTFAGPYVELFLWSLATIAWRVTEPDTLINYVALIVMTLSGIRSFVDLNPFVKLDGYYLLNDYLEMPNLRRRSFKYVGDGIKRFLGFGSGIAPHVTARERRIYLLYGLVATVSSLSLLSFGVVKVGSYLIDNHQPMALLFLVCYATLRSGRRFRRLFGQKSSRLDPDDDGDIITSEPESAPEWRARESRPPESRRPESRPPESRPPEAPPPETRPPAARAPEAHPPEAHRPESRAPESPPPETRPPAARAPEAHPPEPHRPEPRAPESHRPASPPRASSDKHSSSSRKHSSEKARPSRKRALVWTLGATAAAAVLFLVHLQLRIAGPFIVLPDENADVRAAVEGIVEEIRVHEGDHVETGAVIARLADKDFRAELLKTEAQVREARANLRKLQTGTTAESLGVARAAVSKAEDAARFAQGKLSRSKLLFERQALSPQEFEGAQEQASTADNNLAEARSELRVLVRGNRPEEIEAAKAQLDRLEAQQRYLETQLGLLDVLSPASGVVATPARELKEMIGQFVAKGALIAKVYTVKTVTGQIVITEKDIGEVQVGQQVVLKSRSYPDAVFRGTVTTIATAAEGLPSATAEASAGKPSSTSGTGVRGFVVTTQIDNTLGLLKPGMTGLAKVVGGERRVVDLVKRRLTHTFKVEFWSWW